MSLTVATCRCGRRWYRFERAEWDTEHTLAWCPGCHVPGGRQESAVAGWAEL